jgi:hypothetical protein
MKEHIKYFHFLNAFRELGFKRCETFSSGTKFRYAERSPTAQFPTKKNLTPPSIELRKKKNFYTKTADSLPLMAVLLFHCPTAHVKKKYFYSQ